MAKQLNVALNFTAETGQAKTAIQELQASLSKIAHAGTGNIVGNSAQQIKEASDAAKQLQYHLNNAFNVSTGNFDLSRLDKSLQSSKTNIADLSAKLLGAGQTGQQAFAQLAQSISMADQPMFRVNAKLAEMVTTLKNTARWQISSSIIHGFMGTIQHAYGYAQDLNESLNNIRIVTGQNVDQMAKFAEQANKSAKALSTTTTEYTNASLIYYQQGLSDAEVKERTDVTVKMANAAGVSAQTVSDQITAVWNNFDDGSKSLEYYADVMTALGAATASSTSEIADGLEKFAAVSETVGLSYEYATAALATVTATTRQSADVVGNAFKTLFARIQGLNLGETLDDGTTLNKYSQALEKVGISIFEQNGQMKEMDKILDEMGAKWDTLDKTQQTALAQTVAGVRQYTQLVALMDNWDYFGKNLEVAKGAEGTLQKQADIYTESWEAARDRVAAAAESIYQNLLDDKFFITINNGFADLLTGVGEFIKGIGGAKGVITMFASVMLSNFAHKIPEAIQNLQYNLTLLTRGSAQAYKKIQADMVASTEKAFSGQLGSTISKDSAMGFSIDSANQLAAARLKLSMASSKMTDAEKQLAQMELNLAQSQQQEIIAIKQKNEALIEEINLTQKAIESGEALNTEKIRDKAFKAEDSMVKRRQDTESIAELDSLDQFHSDYSKLLDSLERDIQTKIGQPLMQAFNKGLTTGKFQEVTLNLSHLSSQVEQIKKDFNSIDDVGIEEVRNRISDLTSLLPNSIKQSSELRKVLSEINKADSGDQMNQALDKLVKTLTNCKIPANDLKRILSEIYGNDRIESLTSRMTQYKNGVEKAEQATNRLKTALAAFQPTHVVTGLEAITAAAAGLGNLAMGLTSIKSTFQTLSNPDLSGWEKFSSVLMGISMIVPMVLSSIRNYMAVQSFLNGLIDINTGKIIANNIAMIASIDITNEESLANAAAAARHLLKTAAIDSEQRVMIKGKTVTLAYALAQAIAEKGTYKAAIAYLFETGVIDADTLAKLKNLAVTQLLYAKIFAIIAIVAIAAFAISKLVTAQKEANEAIEEANQKYDEEKQKLEELKNQLKSVQDRIKELQALGTLSITEQEELNNLKEQEASLQRQIAMQEELAKAAQRNQANEIAKNWGKSQKLTTEDKITKTTGEYTPSGNEIYETLDEYKARMGFDGSEKWIRENAEAYQKILEWQKEIDDNHAKWLEENREQIQANEDNYSSYIKAVKAGAVDRDDEKIAEMQGDLKDQRQKIYGDNYDEKVLSPLIDGLSRTFASDFKADGSTDWSKKVSKESLEAAGVSGADFDAYMDKMVKTALESVTPEELAKLSLDELTILFNNIEALGKFKGDNLIDFINGVKAEINSFDLSSWKKEFNQTKEIIDGLETGDSISTEDYNLLSDEYQRYFTVQADGTAILTGKVEELKALIDGISLEKLRDEIWALQDKTGEGAKAYGSVVGREVSSDYVTGLAERMLADVDAGNAGIWAGSKAEEGMIAATGLDVSSYETAEERIKALAQAWLEVQNALNGYQETLASTAESVDQLEEWFQQGLIDKEEKNNYYDSALIKESQSEDIPYEEVEAYSEILQENNELLKDNEQFSKKVALAHKKTQKGVDKLAEVWDEFNEAVAIKDYQKLSKLMPEINDSLKDVLNLSDKSFENLSSDFAVKNMDLLNDVINGVEGSLEELQVAAATDILINIGIGDGIIEDAQNMLSELAGMTEGTELKIEPEIDNANAFDGLMELLEGAGMTADQIMDVLDAIGWEPQVEYEPIDYDTAQAYYSSGSQQVAILNAGGGYDVISVPLDGEQTLSEDTQYYIPKIVGAKKSSGGGGSYSPPKNNKGGGGGGKQPKHAEKKNDSDKERYHTILNQLEDLESEYDKIADASDRAFGKDKLDAMDDEIKKTDELIAKQEEYLAAISADLPKDKAIMEAYYDDVIGGPAIQFDENGNISNFDEIQDAMYAKYNAMTAYDEESEEWQVFEKKYEQLEKYIEQYEETYDLLRDEEKALQDLINQRLDLLLEEVQYKVELKINIADDSLEMIEFQLNMLEDNAFRAAEAIEYQTEQAEILYDKMQANEQGLRDILSTSDMSVNEIEQLLAGDMSVLQGHTFTEAQIEAIREYKSELLSFSEELQEVRKEVQERLINAFDEWNEELDKGIEKFDHYNSIMENYKNIIEIVGKEYLKIDNKALGNLDQAMVENNINRVKATKDALDALTDTEIRARQAYEDAVARGNENDIQYWKETLETIGDEVESAEEEMMQAWEEALQSAAEAFEAAVESAIENFEKALLPFGTLEEFSNAYEKQKELADQYLDDYQQIYELSKLNRDIANSIDDTKSIAGKQKLKGLMDDINKLQEEGTQLSEYDLEYLQKTYDLRMAEIALEEAQRAKDAVRLTRDNEGNWSYAYTTNTDAADDAAQKYEDALYAMQDLSSEYIDEMSEQLISTSQEMEEALAAVRVEDYASIEEYYKKLDEIQQYYLDRMGYMQGEMQKALDNNKALYEQDWQNYSAATGYKISDDEKFAMSYKDTVLGTLFGSESDIVDFQERVNEALGASDSGLIGELLDAYLQWSQNTDDAMSAAGTSSEDFAEDMDQAVHGDGGIIDSSTAATEAVDDMANQMVAGFDTISSAIERWQSQAGDAADAVIKDYLDVVEAYNLMVRTLSDTKGSESAADRLSSISSDRRNQSTYESTLKASDTSPQKDSSAGISVVSSNWDRTKTMTRMATGGYTGEWGDSPRLALLDEKELVLNEKDTSNFLSAISLTREILNTIDLNAKQASVGLGAMVAGVIKQDILQGLEQSVHITAEFPNVTDHYEVEEALNNLINTSSQYANRK